MWTVACGTLFDGYIFWGLFPTQKEAEEYAKKLAGKDCFVVRIHQIPQEEPKR